MRSSLASLLLVSSLLMSAAGIARADQAATEINYLLDYVAASGCTFVRNGDAHDAADAADHLRLKYNRGERYADTAENFIDRLATESSWSGDPYTVTCGEVTEPSGEWLYRALEEYRTR